MRGQLLLASKRSALPGRLISYQGIRVSGNTRIETYQELFLSGYQILSGDRSYQENGYHRIISFVPWQPDSPIAVSPIAKFVR